MTIEASVISTNIYVVDFISASMIVLGLMPARTDVPRNDALETSQA